MIRIIEGDGRKLSSRTPVLKADTGEVIWHAPAEQALELIRNGAVELLGTKTRVRALRMLAPSVDEHTQFMSSLNLGYKRSQMRGKP